MEERNLVALDDVDDKGMVLCKSTHKYTHTVVSDALLREKGCIKVVINNKFLTNMSKFPSLNWWISPET